MTLTNKISIPFTQTLIKGAHPNTGVNEMRWVAIPATNENTAFTEGDNKIDLKIDFNNSKACEWNIEAKVKYGLLKMLNTTVNELKENPEILDRFKENYNKFQALDGDGTVIHMPLPTTDGENFTGTNQQSVMASMDTFYDAIDLLDEPDAFQKISYTPSSDQLLTDFFKELLAILFQDPIIVRFFFSQNVIIDDNSHKNLLDISIFNAKEIQFSQYRVDSIIESGNNPTIKDKPKQDKTEGLYAYDARATDQKRPEFNTSSDNFFMGYIPFVSTKAKDGTAFVDYLAKRHVTYDFKESFRDDLSNEELNEIYDFCTNDQMGWIFPSAMNETKSGGIANNKLLFHWVGDSLGVKSPLEYHVDKEEMYDEEKDEHTDTLVSEFIRNFLFDKTEELPTSKLVPLIDGRTYNIGMFPMFVTGQFPTLSNDTKIFNNELLTGIINISTKEKFSKAVTFSITDPVNSPEIIPKRQLIDCTKNSNSSQVVLLHKMKSKKRKKIKEYFVIAPPRIEFNLARWLNSFEVVGDGFGEVYSWIEKIRYDIPDEWKRSVQRPIPYLFDKRVAETNYTLIVKLYNSYNEKEEKCEEPYEDASSSGFSDVSFYSNLPASNATMSDVEGIELELKSVKEKDYFNKKDIKDYITSYAGTVNNQNGITIHVPEGRKMYATFQLGNNGPLQIMSITNAVAKLSEEDQISTSFDIISYMRDNSSEGGKKTHLEFTLENINYYAASNYYLFRKYIGVNPSEYDGLPSLSSLLKERKQKYELDVASETDDMLFSSSKTKIESENEDYDEEDIGLIPVPRAAAESRRSNRFDVLHPDNVFSLKEVFGELKIEILKPEKENLEPNGTLIRNDKIFLHENHGFGKYEFKADLTDTIRSKTIEYLNLKLYSKHLDNYEERKLKKSIQDLDLNITVKSPGIDSKIIIDHGLQTNNQVKSAPPKFVVDLVYLDKHEENTDEFSRSGVVMITVPKNELNLISDDEYIGVDFSNSTEKIAGIPLNALNTDIGVDFTLQSRDKVTLDPTRFKSIVSVDPDRKKDKPALYVDPKGTDVDTETEGDFKFFKPVFIYSENVGAIFIHIENAIWGEDVDPFLKISLCRGYKSSGGNWHKTPSSKPQYMQLSSKRTLTVKNDGDLLKIKLSPFQITKKNRSRYFITFFEKAPSAISDPETFALHVNGKDLKRTYIPLDKENNTISNIDNTPNMSNLHYRIFEFHAFDNIPQAAPLPEVSIDSMINEDSFNPLDSSYFKLVLMV